MAWLRIDGFVIALAAVMTLVSPVTARLSAHAQMGEQSGEQEAQGCACDRQPKRRTCQEAWQVKAIFVGRVLEVTPGRPPELDKPDRPVSSHDDGPPPVRKMRIEVREVLGGVESMRRAPNARMTGAVRQIDVYTYHGGDTDCGYDFDIGESYLVYAYAAGLAAGDDSSLVTHRCTRTRSLSEAEEDLAYLRSVMSDTGARPAGMLHGTLAVLREDYSRIDPDRLTSFSPAGIPLVLAQDGRTWRATTGQDGAFMFTGLPGGQFSMQAELDGTPFWMEEEHNFSLPNARACQEVGVIIRDDGRLRTRVLTADGRPARGLQIHLMGARDDGVLTHTGKSETTDVGGWVAFAALPPGRYVLGLGLYLETAGPVTQRTPLLAASYVEATRRRGHRAPGLPDVPGATSSVPNAAESDTPSVRRMPGELVVTLGLGQHVVTEDLMLPDTTAIVPITGRVVTPAGQPVPNVEVRLVLSLDEDYESHPLTAEHVRVDADGRFQLQGVLGRRYWIAAKSVEGAVPVKLVTPVEKFLTTRELPPVTVIVTFDSR